MAVSPSPSLTLRKELQEYIRSCERLLSSAMPSTNTPLSREERDIVEYYQEELKAQLHTRQIP